MTSDDTATLEQWAASLDDEQVANYVKAHLPRRPTIHREQIRRFAAHCGGSTSTVWTNVMWPMRLSLIAEADAIEDLASVTTAHLQEVLNRPEWPTMDGTRTVKTSTESRGTGITAIAAFLRHSLRRNHVKDPESHVAALFDKVQYTEVANPDERDADNRATEQHVRRFLGQLLRMEARDFPPPEPDWHSLARLKAGFLHQLRTGVRGRNMLAPDWKDSIEDSGRIVGFKVPKTNGSKGYDDVILGATERDLINEAAAIARPSSGRVFHPPGRPDRCLSGNDLTKFRNRVSRLAGIPDDVDMGFNALRKHNNLLNILDASPSHEIDEDLQHAIGSSVTVQNYDVAWTQDEAARFAEQVLGQGTRPTCTKCGMALLPYESQCPFQYCRQPVSRQSGNASLDAFARLAAHLDGGKA